MDYHGNQCQTSERKAAELTAPLKCCSHWRLGNGSSPSDCLLSHPHAATWPQHMTTARLSIGHITAACQSLGR